MNEIEKAQASKALVLIVAALNHSLGKMNPSDAFDNAEAFAAEAEKRGCDLSALADLA
jgi:hypothetical protein